MCVFDHQVHVEEHIPYCPYCGRELDDDSSGGFHAECNIEYARDLELAFGGSGD